MESSLSGKGSHVLRTIEQQVREVLYQSIRQHFVCNRTSPHKLQLLNQVQNISVRCLPPAQMRHPMNTTQPRLYPYVIPHTTHLLYMTLLFLLQPLFARLHMRLGFWGRIWLDCWLGQ